MFFPDRAEQRQVVCWGIRIRRLGYGGIDHGG